MHVESFMTKNPVSISKGEVASVAARMLARNNIGILPVCQGGRLCGVVTDRDIAVRCVAAEKPPGATPVSAIMTEKVATCGPGDSVEQVAKSMAKAQVHRLPVVSQNRLVGMVSLSDLTKIQGFSMEIGRALAEIDENVRKEKNSEKNL